MKNYTDIIIRPLLTEKSNLLSEVSNKYVFQVAKNANKVEIKNSIEARFDVKVKKVSTINCKGKNKNMSIKSNGRVIRTNGKRSDWRKAIITLMDDYKIGDTLLTGGGIIPQEDIDELSGYGVGRLFGPGTAVHETIDYIQDWYNNNRERNNE